MEATAFKEIKDPVIKSKIGFIKITPMMFRTEGGIATLNALYKVVTPLRSISYDRCLDSCERTLCYCEQFREIKEGEIPPEYIATFTRSEDGTITLTQLKERNSKNATLTKSINHDNKSRFRASVQTINWSQEGA